MRYGTHTFSLKVKWNDIAFDGINDPTKQVIITFNNMNYNFTPTISNEHTTIFTIVHSLSNDISNIGSNFDINIFYEGETINGNTYIQQNFVKRFIFSKGLLSISNYNITDKYYDGNNIIASHLFSNINFIGAVGSDIINYINPLGVTNSINAGATKGKLTSLQLTGLYSEYYEIDSGSYDAIEKDINIIKRPITNNNINFNSFITDKIYDGTSIVTNNVYTYLIDGNNVFNAITDLVALSDGIYIIFESAETENSSKDVGVYNIKLINPSLSSTNNYELQLNGDIIGGPISILPLDIKVSISANDKYYDGLTTATFTTTFDKEFITGDEVSFFGIANFSNSLPGINKTVLVTNPTFSGNDSNNYRVSLNSVLNNQAHILTKVETGKLRGVRDLPNESLFYFTDTQFPTFTKITKLNFSLSNNFLQLGDVISAGPQIKILNVSNTYKFIFSTLSTSDMESLGVYSESVNGVILKVIDLEENIISQIPNQGLLIELYLDANIGSYVVMSVGSESAGYLTFTSYNSTINKYIYSGYLLRGDGLILLTGSAVPCFTEPDKILCEDDQYKAIQDLKVGDKVQTYLHGPKKIIYIYNGKAFNGMDWKTGLYKLPKTGNMIDDLVLTGGHSILVENILEEEDIKQKAIYGDFKRDLNIDGKKLILAAACNQFIKVEDKKTYNFYHLILDDDGDQNKSFGVWSNGILCETMTRSYYINLSKYPELSSDTHRSRTL